MRTFAIAVAVWVLRAAVAVAQEPAPAAGPRGDVQFVLGGQSIRLPLAPPYDGWQGGVLYGGGGGGWYWTGHLKAQVELAANTGVRRHHYGLVPVNGQNMETQSRVSVERRSLAVAQQYQFFRNRSFHPRVGAGIDIARETRTGAYGLTLRNIATGVYQQVTPRIDGPHRRTIARPFAEIGFKSYMAQRAFVTLDSRVLIRHGIDEVLLRLGLGVDF